MSATELRELVIRLTDRNCPSFRATRGELAHAIGYSLSTISLWLNGKYEKDARNLERAIGEWVRKQERTVVRTERAKELTAGDRRKLHYIHALISNAENKEALLESITGTISGGSSCAAHGAAHAS